jgi:outer membrane protein OmpA-like peptidoglycan-associated protein
MEKESAGAGGLVESMVRLLILAAALGISTLTSAQEMSREEIKRSLDEQAVGEQGQSEPARPGARVSSVRGVGGPQVGAASVPRPLAFRQIQFAFGSAELTPSSFPTLDELANALADAMGDPKFRGMVFPIIG